MSIQSYDIQIPAGGAQTLEAGGQIFDFLSSGSAFDQIQVLPEFQQGNVTLRLGQGFDAGKIVNRWYIKNTGTTAINGMVVLSTAGFRNFRISGDVNVLDGAKSRSISGAAFTLANATTAPGAGAYARIQLWNPAGSNTRLIVESVAISAAATGYTANVSFNSASLGGAPISGISKNSAIATAPAAVCYRDVTQTQLDTFPALYQLAAPANGLQPFVPKEPYVVKPGYGLLLWSNNAALAMTGLFEWFEEPDT
ncbi:hypothetical protein [Burkholderia cenocepacia]|uniref:hypothetical protein n=1 Tax=Burkholderia cenocepacia TaxID=95486 RepID=UPI002AB0CCE6|nr:hypothetical protein [Burkholderia cenocepacia]